MAGVAVQLVLWFQMRKGDLSSNKIIFIAVVVTFLLFLIGFFQIFRITSAWKKDVEKNCVAGVCESFIGSLPAIGVWGPALGWWSSLIGFLASFANVIVIFIRVQGDGGVVDLFTR